MRNEKWITAVLLLLLTISAAAQDVMIQRGCRVGKLRPRDMVLHRGTPGGQPKQVGGNFYKGELHQLVVMVAYADRDFKGDETATLELWNKIFNAEGYAEGSFRGSVRDYFSAQSYNQFLPVFDLVFVRVSGNASKYASTASDDENSQYLVQDIMEVLETRDINWSLYDWDADGFINQLLIIYAGKGMNAGGGSDTVWPHQWWLSEHMKDRQEGVYCDPIPVSYGENQYLVDSYCCVQEEVNTSNVQTSFGTICHEYSHCFGFPDFYGGKKYVYDWDLMDSGNYNDKGFCPANYSAHERWLMGWLTPTELEYNTTITNMHALTDEGVAYLIRNEGFEDEYYMVENRQQEGWDSELPGSGLVIFHIDFDPSIWTSTTDAPNSSRIQRYTIFKADNGRTVSTRGWGYPYQDNDSLTNLSVPAATLNNENTDGTKLMNKSVRDIAVTDGLASFRFTVDTPTGIEEHTSQQSAEILYGLGPISIIRYSNGTIKKVMKHKNK